MSFGHESQGSAAIAAFFFVRTGCAASKAAHTDTSTFPPPISSNGI